MAVTVEVAAVPARRRRRVPPRRPPGTARGVCPPLAPATPASGPPASGTPVAGQLRIERQTLPPATRNLPYTQAVPVAGGTPPYAMRVVRGPAAGRPRADAGMRLRERPAFRGTTRSSSPSRTRHAAGTIAQPLALRVIILQPDTALVVSPPAISLRLPGRSRARQRAALAVGERPPEARVERRAPTCPWLMAPAAGVSPAPCEIIALGGRLPPGTHVGTVTVTMEGAPNSPASVPVQVTVPR